MKKILIALVSLSLVWVGCYKAYEFYNNLHGTINTTITSENNNTSNDKNSSISKTENEENKKIDRSKIVDVNKVDEIIRKKLPKGTIINLEFKNDSKNPHYEVTAISENVKYEFEVSLKDGAIKEVKKEKLKTSN